MRSTRSCAATVAGRRSALSNASRAWRACSPAALAFRPPSGTRNAQVPSCRRGRDATASSPALRSRAACGASPWSTSTTRVPRRSSEDSQAQVRRKLRCSLASALRRHRPRHCPSAPKTYVIADNSRRRNAANVASRHGARLRPRTAALPQPPRAKSTSRRQPNRHCSTPPTPHPTTPTPAWATFLSIPAAASAWSLPTRARRQRPCAPCCAATARAGTSQTAFSSITATFRHRCARRPRSSCATKSRRRRPSPPPRWSSALISVAWSARSRLTRRLPSAPFCSAWGAQAVATFRPRCGLSCARKNPSRAR